jgi:hypothetical protein
MGARLPAGIALIAGQTKAKTMKFFQKIFYFSAKNGTNG